MPDNNVIKLITSVSFDTELILTVIKLALLFLEIVYSVYAFIVIRQVSIMNKNYTAELYRVFKVAARLHFFTSVVLVMLSLILFY